MHQTIFDLLSEMAAVIERAFRKIEQCVPSPTLISRGSYKVFRYKEETVEAAVVQKCARLVSGLNASLVLLKAGYVQELGALFRMLDEFSEDIFFLCEAIRTGELTNLQREYLQQFYQEEFDNPDSSLLSTQNRPTVSRRKIHAAISRIPGQELNPSDHQEVRRTLSQAYSGFVHAASTHVMDMYGGSPGRFHVAGMTSTLRIEEFIENAWDYFYRGLITIMWVSGTFKQEDLLRALYEFRAHIEERSNRTEWKNPDELVKREKQKNA